jgi:signal transduction histidine kinase/CheY-like chemotaxis protein
MVRPAVLDFPAAAVHRANLHAQQAEALDSLYVATGVAAILMMAVWATWSEQVRLGVIGAALLVALYPAYLLGGRLRPEPRPERIEGSAEGRYLARAWLLVALWLAAATACFLWASPGLGALLALPVLLAALFLSRAAGLMVALAVSGLLLAGIRISEGIPAATWAAAGAAAWGGAALIWLAQRPQDHALRWSWEHYEEARAELDLVRDAQADLKQAVQDLAEAGVQMRRLNKLLDGARHAAEQAERAKAEFVANVSHELRTPLNMVIGFIELITRAPESYGWVPDALLADLGVVLRNSRHLSALIDDVLDMSQIDAGQMALLRERASLAEIIEAATIAVRPLFESKNLFLEVVVPDDLPPLSCDPLRIREVMLNLLSNAGRFTEAGGVRVSVRQAGGDVLVSVADTGPGIAPEDQARLFRPFEQLDGTARRRYGGTGLGLSISKGFVELHDGKMWVESDGKPGHGTTFYFRLPIEPPPSSEENALRWANPYLPYEERVRRAPVPRPPMHPRLVVVEGGQALGHLLARYLTGAEIASRSDLAAALAELAQRPAQMLVVNSPDVDETLRQVGAADRTAELPVDVPAVICSVPEPGQRAGALGVADYLLKPVTQERLLAALDALGREVRTVLLVDDDPDAVLLFGRMLATAGRGYHVVTANDGEEALALLRDGRAQDGRVQGPPLRPDAIILDLMMPGMSGFGFLAAREGDPALAEIPVILATAQDPQSQPIVSHALTVTTGSGLSVQQLIACVQAFSQIVAPGTPLGDRADPARPAAPPG